MRKSIPVLLLILGFGLGFVVFHSAAGQTPAAPAAAAESAFTYQGHLDVAGQPADGPYDFRFRLFDAATGGNQVGDTVTVLDVAVSAGYFTAHLDFGPIPFAGEARWLELAIRKGGSTDAYTTLSGRQPLTPAPYALRAAEAGSVAWGGVTNVPPGFADGVYNYDSSAPEMRNITASGSGGTQNIGVYNNSSSSPEMGNVTASGSGAGTFNIGVYNVSSSPTIRHSRLEGSTRSVYGGGAVANSQLVGPADSGLTCFNNYDANLNAVVCP